MSSWCNNCGMYTYGHHMYGGCCSQKCYNEYMTKKYGPPHSHNKYKY